MPTFAASSATEDRDAVNLSEHGVTLRSDKPSGRQYEPAENGRVHVGDGVHKSQADSFKLFSVGDILKTASSVNGDDPCLAKTMTAIVQRERDVRPVLERTPVVPPGTVDRAGVNGSDCNAVGSGPPGQVDLLGAGSVGPVPLANGEESGILAAPERAEATHTRISSASAAAVPPDRRELEGLPQDVCAALIQLESRIRLVEPGILLCSSPLTPPLMALLCAEHDVGGVLSLVQPYEYGANTSSLQTAAMVAGARRVTIPLEDLHKPAIGRCLPNAAAALQRLRAWVGPERKVLVTAADGQSVVVPTVVAGFLHWHCAKTLESLSEEPSLRLSADLRLVMDTGDRILIASSPLAGFGSASGDTELGRGGKASPVPALKLRRVTFAWKHPAKKVELVGEPVGGWGEMRAMELQADGGHALTLDLPAGTYAFKFIVEGKWLDAADQRYGVDVKGNRNNAVHVTHSSHEASDSESARPAAAQPTHAQPPQPSYHEGLSAEQFTALVRMQAGKLAESLDGVTLLPPVLLGHMRRASSSQQAQQQAAAGAAQVDLTYPRPLLLS